MHLDRNGVMLAAHRADRQRRAGHRRDRGDRRRSSTSTAAPTQPTLQELLPREWTGAPPEPRPRGPRAVARRHEALRDDAEPARHAQQLDIDPLTAGTQDLYKTFGYGDSNGVTGGRCDGVTTGPENTGGAGSTNFYRNVRIVELDISNPASPVVTGEWIYRLELQNAARLDDPGPPARQRHRVGRPAQAARRRARRRRARGDRHSTGRKLYEVDLNGATNLATTPRTTRSPSARRASRAIDAHPSTQPLGCFLDGGTAAELAALPTPVVPVDEDARTSTSAPAGVGFNFNKVEGVALLDGHPRRRDRQRQRLRVRAGATTCTISPAADPTEQLRIYTTQPTRDGADRQRHGDRPAGR